MRKRKEARERRKREQKTQCKQEYNRKKRERKEDGWDTSEEHECARQGRCTADIRE